MANPLELIYQFGDRLNKNMKKPRALKNAKVLSIGNITTGGTGKTPATIYFASALQNEDYKIGILSRGYGGTLSKENNILSDGKNIFLDSTESGDEPYLLAVNLAGIPIGVGRKRYESGLLLQEKFDTSLFILDDGFQHYALERDVDIVLVDATNPFGNRHTLPNGILREPLDALKRSDIVIITKADVAASTKVEELAKELKELSGHEMIFRSSHRPVGFIKLPREYSIQGSKKQKLQKLDIIKNESVWALSAIGNHRAFEFTLKQLGASDVENITFRDHYEYTKNDIDNILKRVEPYDFLITTEKDWVRLQKFSDAFSELKNFYYLKVNFEIMQNEVLLKEGLKAKLMAGKSNLNIPNDEF